MEWSEEGIGAVLLCAKPVDRHNRGIIKASHSSINASVTVHDRFVWTYGGLRRTVGFLLIVCYRDRRRWRLSDNDARARLEAIDDRHVSEDITLGYFGRFSRFVVIAS